MLGHRNFLLLFKAIFNTLSGIGDQWSDFCQNKTGLMPGFRLELYVI